MDASPTQTDRTQQTRDRLMRSAIELFERHGYDATTAAEIARAAGVTEMTFFRHFPTKAALLLDDPYDPDIVAAVAAQAQDLPAILRVIRGLRAATGALDETELPTIRRRIRVAATTPSLAAAVHASTETTARAIADQLISDGVRRFDAEVAATAALAALTRGLLHWSVTARGSLQQALSDALDVLEAAHE